MLPLPPPELRRTVGPLDDAAYDNPSGWPVYAHEEPAIDYTRVLDFGCGCGRMARQMMQQRTPPKGYLGIDLNPDSIAWCSANLAPAAPGFRFEHLDVYNVLHNPAGRVGVLPLPAASGAHSFILAHSVFTHILEDAVPHYLAECARALAPDGYFRSTWLVFNKDEFPPMQPQQNALFTNPHDLTNAVYFDARWIRAAFTTAGLVITKMLAPGERGSPWRIFARHAHGAQAHVAMPADWGAVTRHDRDGA